MPAWETIAFATVMDVSVRTSEDPGTEIFNIDSFQITNISMEGPRKEARGGADAEPLIRYGKTVTIELEDVFMREDSLKHFGGGEYNGGKTEVSFGTTFSSSTYTLVGTTFVVGQDGEEKPVTVTMYNFLPNQIFDITMESEGDIGVMNITGELFPNEDGKFFEIENLPVTEAD